MCGRFLFSDEDRCPEIRRFCTLAEEKFPGSGWSRGEVTPGSLYPILVRGKEKADMRLVSWGYTRERGAPLINARAESVEQRVTFAEDFRSRRCVILTTGFFEWGKDEERTKFLFTAKEPVMYLAGIYSTEGRFVVLTTEANKSVRGIHSRMPVIIPGKQVRLWLCTTQAAREMLSAVMPELTAEPVR